LSYFVRNLALLTVGKKKQVNTKSYSSAERSVEAQPDNRAFRGMDLNLSKQSHEKDD